MTLVVMVVAVIGLVAQVFLWVFVKGGLAAGGTEIVGLSFCPNPTIIIEKIRNNIFVQ